MSTCPNCSADVTAQYCPACGQKRIHPQDLSARRFVHELADELAKLNFKFKTLRSLRALMTPGLLTKEYLAGRREPYLSPIKISRLVSAGMAQRGMDRALFNARFDVRVQSVYTLGLGVAVVVSALMLQWLYHRRNLPYGAHLVFSLHYLSFQYLLSVPAGAARGFGVSEDTASAFALFLLAVYVFSALKRAYMDPTGLSVLKAGVLFFLTVAINYVVSFGAIRITLALV